MNDFYNPQHNSVAKKKQKNKNRIALNQECFGQVITEVLLSLKFTNCLFSHVHLPNCTVALFIQSEGLPFSFTGNRGSNASVSLYFHMRAKWPSLALLLTCNWGRKNIFKPFPRSENQTSSSGIWSWITDSISNANNRYDKHASYLRFCTLNH